MEPFISKFCCTSNHVNHVFLQYKTDSELNIVLNGDLAIDSPWILECSGSLVTKAMGDPTQDESTDR